MNSTYAACGSTVGVCEHGNRSTKRRNFISAKPLSFFKTPYVVASSSLEIRTLISYKLINSNKLIKP